MDEDGRGRAQTLTGRQWLVVFLAAFALNVGLDLALDLPMLLRWSVVVVTVVVGLLAIGRWGPRRGTASPGDR